VDTANLQSYFGSLLKTEGNWDPVWKIHNVVVSETRSGMRFRQTIQTRWPGVYPGGVRSSDEPAKCQWLPPAIGFHSLKNRPAEGAPAIRCFPHAGLDVSGA
jgi:hypothetical protein